MYIDNKYILDGEHCRFYQRILPASFVEESESPFFINTNLTEFSFSYTEERIIVRNFKSRIQISSQCVMYVMVWKHKSQWISLCFYRICWCILQYIVSDWEGMWWEVEDDDIWGLCFVILNWLSLFPVAYEII